MDIRKISYSHTLLLAPFVFVCHFLEESPGFVEWMNTHLSRGITSGLFWRVNIYALLLTLIVVLVEWFSRSAFSLILALFWFSLLMLANAIFHIAGGLLDGRYVPGLLTALLLYLPYYAWLFRGAFKSRRVGIGGLLAATVLGSLPMLIHGYLILFRARRLF